MGSTTEVYLKGRVDMGRANLPNSGKELPDGVELIIHSKKEPFSYPSKERFIFITEQQEVSIYLKIKEGIQHLTLDELTALISAVREHLAELKIDSEVKLKEWLRKQLQDDTSSELEPEWIQKLKNWDQGWLPILLLKRNQKWWEASFLDLLSSYLNEDYFEVILSDSAMMIFVSNRHLQLEKGNWTELEEFAEGLYEMLQNEWGDEIKIGIHDPAFDVREMILQGRELIQDIQWVQSKWNQVKLFFPWRYYIERFIYKIPEKDITDLKLQLWNISDELYQTLEVFFAENLNMSEAAKKLYIHRNTLQYRLDKIKLQTGLDVKTFTDAVIAKVMILLKQRVEQSAQEQG